MVLGLAPLITLLAGLGLLGVGLANSLAYTQPGAAAWVWWIGLGVIFLPAVMRVVATDATHAERVTILVVVGVSLYAHKLIRSPGDFIFYDELLHVRTLEDILVSGRLFVRNPLLPVSSTFPTLEVVTAVLIRLTGLDIVTAGVLVVGAARVALVLGLYAFFKLAAGDDRTAALGGLIYASNPQFHFFDSQYAYESLALGFIALVFWALATRKTPQIPARAISVGLVVLLGVVSLVTTHHLSTYSFMGLLVVWMLVERFTRLPDQRRSLVMVVLFVVLASLAWLIYVAPLTLTYLADNAADMVSGMVEIMQGQDEARELFSSGTTAPPIAERVTTYVALLLLGAAMGVGLLDTLFTAARRDPLRLFIAAAALAYPLSQVTRLTQGGLDIAARLAAFTYIPFALGAALGVIALLEGRVWAYPVVKRLRFGNGLQRVVTRSLVFVVPPLLLVAFYGNVILGLPQPVRLPGEYLPAADIRTIDDEAVEAARRVAVLHETPVNIAGDRIHTLLMGVYGRQTPITASFESLNVPALFRSDVVGPDERFVLDEGDVAYLVVDERITSGLPLYGFYFEVNEGVYEEPISLDVLRKFEDVPGIHRVFDSGNVTLYDTRALTGEPDIPSQVVPRCEGCDVPAPRDSWRIGVGVFGALLILIVPGWMLRGALFPRERLSVGESSLLVSGLSLCAAAAAAYLLVMVRLPLLTEGLAFTLGVVTVVGALVAWGRGYRPALPDGRVLVAIVLVIVVWVLPVGAGYWLAFEARVESQAPFTQLWLTPERDAVGVASYERDEAMYTLVVQREGAVLSEETVTLSPGEVVTVPLDEPTAPYSVILGKEGEVSTYRYLSVSSDGE